jgi:hypothetical protein
MGRFQILKNRDTNERVVEKLIADALTVDDDPMDRYLNAIENLEAFTVAGA